MGKERASDRGGSMTRWKSFKKIVAYYTWALKMAMKERRIWMILVLGFYIIIFLMPNAELLIGKAVLSHMEEGQSATAYLAALLGLLLFTLVLVDVGNVIYMLFYEKIRYVISNQLFEKVLRRMNSQPLNAYESTEDYERMERLVAAARYDLHNLISGNLSFYATIFQTLVYVVMVAATVPVMTAPMLLVALVPYCYRMDEAEEETELEYGLQSENRQAEYLTSLIADGKAQKELRLYGSFSKVYQKWRKVYQNIYKKRYAHFQKWNGRKALYQCIGCVLKIGILMAGIALYYYKQISFSTMFFLYQCQAGLSTSVGWFASIVPNGYGAACRMDECRKFIDDAVNEDGLGEAQENKTTEENVGGPGHWEIRLSHVSFQYPKGGFGIRDISLTIGHCQVIALLGENGSGKTTLTKLIMGLYKPDSGQIQYFANGEECKADQFFSCVFQDYATYHLTLRENVGLGDVERIRNDGEIREHMRNILCGDILDDVGGDLEQTLGKMFDLEGKELSGGQWQRLANARALYGSRLALVFDEPTARLDPLAELKQMKEIQEKFQGRTVILVSHRIGFARMADVICYMKNGEIVETGNHESLMNRRENYYELFRTQAQWYDMEDYDEPVPIFES